MLYNCSSFLHFCTHACHKWVLEHTQIKAFNANASKAVTRFHHLQLKHVPTVHTIFLQCSGEGSILNTGSTSVCACVSVWVGVGGVTDCGPTDHRKPQEIEVGGGPLWSGQTWSNMSRYLSAITSLALSNRVSNDNVQRRKPVNSWDCHVASNNFFLHKTNRGTCTSMRDWKLGIVKYCVTKVPGCVLSQQLIPFLYF